MISPVDTCRGSHVPGAGTLLAPRLVGRGARKIRSLTTPRQTNELMFMPNGHKTQYEMQGPPTVRYLHPSTLALAPAPAPAPAPTFQRQVSLPGQPRPAMPQVRGVDSSRIHLCLSPT